MIADTPNGRITYRGEMPPEIHAALVPLLEKHKHLLPDWCHHINVSYYCAPPKDSDRAAAQTIVDYEYRTAYLDIYPGFLPTHDDKRCEFIQHEMIHVTVNPLYNYAQTIIERVFESDALKDNTVLKNLILDELRHRNESVTTDLQKIIGQLMESKENENGR